MGKNWDRKSARKDEEWPGQLLAKCVAKGEISPLDQGGGRWGLPAKESTNAERRPFILRRARKINWTQSQMNVRRGEG